MEMVKYVMQALLGWMVKGGTPRVLLAANVPPCSGSLLCVPPGEKSRPAATC